MFKIVWHTANGFRRSFTEIDFYKNPQHVYINTYSALVSGVGRSPIVVSVSVDQYNEPKYFLVSVA